jgi:hypothetical protein
MRILASLAVVLLWHSDHVARLGWKDYYAEFCWPVKACSASNRPFRFEQCSSESFIQVLDPNAL